MPMLGGRDCGTRECCSRPWSWWSGILARRLPHGFPCWTGCGIATLASFPSLADLKENAERRRSDDPEMGRCLAGKVRRVRPRADRQAERCTHQHHRCRANWQPHRNIAAPSSCLCRSGRHQDCLAGDGRYVAARWARSRPNRLRQVLGVAAGDGPSLGPCSPMAANSG